MTLTYHENIDVSYLTLIEGEYDQSLPFEFEAEGVTLNVDVDAAGRGPRSRGTGGEQAVCPYRRAGRVAAARGHRGSGRFL